jgi:hypothetical protein
MIAMGAGESPHTRRARRFGDSQPLAIVSRMIRLVSAVRLVRFAIGPAPSATPLWWRYARDRVRINVACPATERGGNGS